MEVFKQQLERSEWKDGFLKNEPLPEKYYKWPLCNISQDLYPTEDIVLDNATYFRASPAIEQQKEVGHDIKKSFDLSLVNDKKNTKLWDWIKSWHFKNPISQIHNQQPGQLLNFHMDVINSYNQYIPDPTEKKNKVRRVFVFLNDWSIGQIVMLGTKSITNWKKGDVLWFDWYNVPHATANMSRQNRMMIQVTGETTPEFEQLIRS